MPRMPLRPHLAIPLAATLVACAMPDRSVERALTVEPFASPTGPGAAEPNLATTADGRALLSWLEPGPDTTHALRIARLGEDGAWSAPREVLRRRDLFVNWADFPSVIALADGRLLAHWLQRNGTGRYAYEVRLAESRDSGATWSASATPHTAGIEAEHGFVAMLPTADSGAAIAFLNGGAGHEDGHGPAMHLGFATWGRDGVTSRAVLDHRVCDCCQTGIAMTARGPIVVYRDRSDDEIRDMSVVRLVDGVWTAPRTLHPDGWHVTFCPVNGPAISALGDAVAVAWFAAPHDSARVQVVFSSDGGARFGSPVRVDLGSPSGRVAIALIDAGTALVTWVERGNGDEAAVMARLVSRRGAAGAPVTVSSSRSTRASGFPRLARTTDGAVMAWTIPGTPSEVRTARVRIGER